jgi:predicted Zn-dependent peptidase
VQGGDGIPVAAIELWYRAPSTGFGASPVPSLARLAAEVVVASKPITGKPFGTLVGDLGGRTAINVYADSVTISALVPAPCAPQVVKAMTTAFFAPVVTDDGYHEALHAVEQEALLNSFNPDNVARDAVFESLFSDGSAHYPVLSDPQAVQKISLDEVRLFATRAFRSQNALLVVNGDVDPSITGTAVAGRAPDSAAGSGARGESPAPSLLAAASPRLVTRTLDEEGGAYGWVGPPISAESEATAMDFIADYLFRPDVGLVTKELAEAQQGASVAGQFITLRDPGVFLVSYTAKDTAQAKKLIDRGLANMRAPIDKELFAALLDAFEYHLLSDLQTPLSLADNFGWYAVEGNPGYAPGIGGDRGAYFRQMRSLTPDFVAHVAQKYLAKPNVTVQFTPSSPAPKSKGSGAS